MKFIIDYFNRLSIPSKKEIMDYYPTYLQAHKNPVNKVLHIIGNFLTVAYIILIIKLCILNILFLPLIILTPFVIYITAWPGHFIYEKNKPATFVTNPVLTKICDWVMIFELITKKLKFDTRNHE